MATNVLLQHHYCHYCLEGLWSCIIVMSASWAVFFFNMLWLYTGTEVPRKAPQGHRLCKRRLRAPTRDTFAYAKRLREESRKDLFLSLRSIWSWRRRTWRTGTWRRWLGMKALCLAFLFGSSLAQPGSSFRKQMFRIVTSMQYGRCKVFLSKMPTNNFVHVTWFRSST